MRSLEERSTAGYHRYYHDQYNRYKPINLKDTDLRERIPPHILDMLLFEQPVTSYEGSSVSPSPDLEELKRRRAMRPTAFNDPLNDYYNRLVREGPSASATNPENLTPKERVRVEKLYHSTRRSSPRQSLTLLEMG